MVAVAVMALMSDEILGPDPGATKCHYLKILAQKFGAKILLYTHWLGHIVYSSFWKFSEAPPPSLVMLLRRIYYDDAPHNRRRWGRGGGDGDFLGLIAIGRVGIR